MFVGLLLVLLEIFIPSGGIIAFLSASSILASIIMAFVQAGPLPGFVFLLIACIGVPITLAVAFRFLPDTPIGKRLLPNIPTTDEVMPDNDLRRFLRQLVGKTGRAKSKMLPSGAVEIEGHTVDAVSEGIPIEPGQWVKVLEVRGSYVVVRPLDESAKPALAPDDVLSQPINTLGLDPFEDPLT
jgi:membrane-bound serine protease (ClpP class)